MPLISSEDNYHPYFPRIADRTGTEQGSEANPVSHDRVSPADGFPLHCAKPGSCFPLPGKQPVLEKKFLSCVSPAVFCRDVPAVFCLSVIIILVIGVILLLHCRKVIFCRPNTIFQIALISLLRFQCPRREFFRFLSHPCPQALFDRICSFILFISRVSARRKCTDALPQLSVISQRSLQYA